MDIENLKLWYLASPYSSKDNEVRKRRGLTAVKSAVELLKQNIHVFSPIAYNCGWEKYKVPSTWTFWEKFDTLFLSKCFGVLVLKIPGWKTSIGVTAEIAYANKRSMPIIYITQGDIKYDRVQAIINKSLSDRIKVHNGISYIPHKGIR